MQSLLYMVLKNIYIYLILIQGYVLLTLVRGRARVRERQTQQCFTSIGCLPYAIPGMCPDLNGTRDLSVHKTLPPPTQPH